MKNGKTIGVIVPAFNEGELIEKTVSTIPDFVDKIIVIEDGSSDQTLDLLKAMQSRLPRLEVYPHAKNMGLGQTLIDGYLKAAEAELDVIAVMAGDAQMHPDDLINVVTPVAMGQVDYVKGNRFFAKNLRDMPLYRICGNAGLTILTKFATGYWHIIDPQCGYTAIGLKALQAIPIEKMTKGYGYNADILNMLNIRNFRVADVDVLPVYGDEVSKIKLYKYIPTVSWLLLRLFFRRLFGKYVFRNFNPVALFYLMGMFLMLCATPLAIWIVYSYAIGLGFAQTSFLCFLFFSVSGVQLLLSAIHFDLLDSRPISYHFDSRYAS